MIASLLIMAVSVAALVYWFRYTCALILDTCTAKDYSAEVAAAHRLSFSGVRDLIDAPQLDFDAVRRSLERDLDIVDALLSRAGKVELGAVPFEELLLRLDFHLMKLAGGLAQPFSEARARAALVEMARVVEYFANAAGERMAEAAQALGADRTGGRPAPAGR